MKLTDAAIKTLPYTTTGQRDIWDTTLPRFGVRIGTRTKTYILNTGTTRLSLGRVGILTLQDARNEAKRRLWAKYLPQTAPSAPSLVEDYLKAISADRKPSTISVYSLYLQRLPNKALSDLTPQLLYAALPSGKGAGNLCFNVFKAYLSWCVERGHLETNCLLRRRQPNKLKSRERLLTDDEVRQIWDQSYNHNSFGALVRLLLLTGQRLNQAACFERSWQKDNTLVFPAYIMKGNTEHAIPVTPLLDDHLTDVDKKLSAAEIKQGREKLRAALPQIPDFRPHDFRRYLSSTMSKLKVPIDITEAILAHKTGSRSAIQRVYDRDTRLPQMRAAFDLYHSHLRELLNLPEPT